jgi:HPr kinase/phosphorylase
LTVTVGELLAAAGVDLKLHLVAGARGLDRPVAVPRLQQPGLALAGFLRQLHPDRVQVLGNSEVSYLGTLAPEAARASVAAVIRVGVACFVVTNGTTPPETLVEPSEAADVPVLVSELRTADFYRSGTGWLEQRLAPEVTLHGNLVDVLGLGILILGPSGIGKSESALDLVTRGHRLVADDAVLVRRPSPSVLRGRAAELLRHHMEIRGLGVIDVEAMFGTLATLDERRIDLVVELSEWAEGADRLGLIEGRHTLLEVALPLVRIPVRPARHIAMLIETAARNQLLRRRGRHSAADFAARIDRAAAGGRRSA